MRVYNLSESEFSVIIVKIEFFYDNLPKRNQIRVVQDTNPELTDMVLIYGEALSNANATRRLYVIK
jgi:hypothetical protein